MMPSVFYKGFGQPFTKEFGKYWHLVRGQLRRKQIEREGEELDFQKTWQAKISLVIFYNFAKKSWGGGLNTPSPALPVSDAYGDLTVVWNHWLQQEHCWNQLILSKLNLYSLEDLLASFVSIMPEFWLASIILRCWRAVDVLESQAVSSSSSVVRCPFTNTHIPREQQKRPLCHVLLLLTNQWPHHLLKK